MSVPDFTGMTVADAQTDATANGLGTINPVDGPTAPTPADVDTIADQDPLPGTLVRPGTDVGVFVFVAPSTTTTSP